MQPLDMHVVDSTRSDSAPPIMGFARQTDSPGPLQTLERFFKNVRVLTQPERSPSAWTANAVQMAKVMREALRVMTRDP